jgi:hypothetical protein
MAAMFRSPSRLLLPLLVLAPLAAQEIDLRTTAKKGGSVWLVVEQTLVRSFEAMGQEVELTQSSTRVQHLTVEEVDDKGNLTVTVAIARIFGKLSGAGEEVTFDSQEAAEAAEDDEAAGMMAAAVKSMQAGAGKSFKAKVSPYGRVLELVDTKAILANTEDTPGLDESQLKQMVEGAFGRLPEKPTAKGGKWPYADGSRGGRMPTKLVAELTLSQVDDETFEIEAAGKIEKADVAAASDADSPAAKAAKSMKVENGKASGKQKISRKDGFLLEARLDSSMDSEMNVMGNNLPMSIKSTSTTKRGTEADAKPAKKAAPKAEEPKKSEGHE